MPCGKKRKRHKIATHKRKKRLRKNRHKKKNRPRNRKTTDKKDADSSLFFQQCVYPHCR